MAFDGFTVAALTSELSQQLTDGRLQKIAQPEADELLLSIEPDDISSRPFGKPFPSFGLPYGTAKDFSPRSA